MFYQKNHMNTVKLICDARERKIQDSINAVFNEPLLFKVSESKGKLECEVKTLSIGDYHILENDENLLAVIERKSLKDYGASFKDGRSENIKNLLNLQLEYPSCKIFYVIEGDFNPDYDTEYAGIKWQNISTDIYQLSIRYGIIIIRTKNGAHTAKELKMLCESYLRNLEYLNEEANKGEDKTRFKGSYEEALNKAKPSPEEKLLNSKINAFATIDRVSPNVAATVIQKYKLSDWILQRIPQDEINDFKINGRKNNALINALKEKPSIDAQKKILSCMAGFSSKTAAEIVDQIQLDDILTGKSYDHVQYGTRNTKLTKKRVEAIINFLN